MCKSRTTEPTHTQHSKSAPQHRSRKYKKTVFRKPTTAGARWLEADTLEQGEGLPLFSVNDDLPQPPIQVKMVVNEKWLTFELDTGATVTVIAESTFHQLFSELPLKESTVRLRTYTGEEMKIIGEVDVKVKYLDQQLQELPLVVVRGSGPSLLGRNWLRNVTLDWNNIKLG